jgi:uncharacterized protein (DUF58 family)
MILVDDYRKYLNPQTLNEIQGLQFKARLIVEGFVSGLHRSPFQGFSVEFAEHREYVPGDDLRYVDWKVYGKTDRHYLKRFEEETNFGCQIIVDTSESMGYQSHLAAVNKLDYARYLAGALSYLIVQQQDAVGLATFDTEVRDYLRASSQPSHLKFLLQTMENASARGETALGPILHQLAERIRKRGVVLILSDLFDDPDAVAAGLRHFHHRRHDVSVLQIVDPAEQDFPFDDPMLFRGLESDAELMSEPRQLKQAYRREFSDFLRQVETTCRDLNMDYELIRTDQPLDHALSCFLSGRSRRAR